MELSLKCIVMENTKNLDEILIIFIPGAMLQQKQKCILSWSIRAYSIKKSVCHNIYIRSTTLLFYCTCQALAYFYCVYFLFSKKPLNRLIIELLNCSEPNVLIIQQYRCTQLCILDCKIVFQTKKNDKVKYLHSTFSFLHISWFYQTSYE